jgi:uncharacterized membrane protein
MTAPAVRRTSLDVLRGLAVLIMIEAHVIDSWTREGDRHSTAFGESLILGGFGAPLFLFLAGVTVAMSAGSKARRLGDDGLAARAVMRRGLEIFALAFLFRFQSFVLSHAPAWTLLKVDVLNIMGPAIVVAAALWLVARSGAARIVVFAAATLAVVLVTPTIRHIGALAAIPDALEGYLRPVPSLTNFSYFPWAAFVTGGAIVGVLLDGARDRAWDVKVNVGFLIGGLLVAGIAYQASWWTPLDPRSRFWTTSLSFYLIRLGLMVAAVGAAWAWDRRPRPRGWSPLELLGQTSLFIYWIHVELVYGVISNPLHGAFSLRGAWTALVAFCVLMLGAAALKTDVARKWRNRKDLHDKVGRPVERLMF